jgi:anaerobic ribonucleoside-triphosphate reductase activating protein
VNGDGLRAVVWTQGCPNHCPGCQNPETWDFDAGVLVDIDDVCKKLATFPGQAGLTFCGGEPMVQPKACKQIADFVRKELGWNVWSFSGFTYEQIEAAGGDAWEFLKSLDEMSLQAFDDQCTGANPRYPKVEEIKQMYLNAYYGK